MQTTFNASILFLKKNLKWKSMKNTYGLTFQKTLTKQRLLIAREII